MFPISEQSDVNAGDGDQTELRGISICEEEASNRRHQDDIDQDIEEQGNYDDDDDDSDYVPQSDYANSDNDCDKHVQRVIHQMQTCYSSIT